MMWEGEETPANRPGDVDRAVETDTIKALAVVGIGAAAVVAVGTVANVAMMLHDMVVGAW